MILVTAHIEHLRLQMLRDSGTHLARTGNKIATFLEILKCVSSNLTTAFINIERKLRRGSNLMPLIKITCLFL